MIVRSTQNTLRSKLLHSKVLVLRALPRAGRTSLLAALADELDDGSTVIAGEDFVRSTHQEIQTEFCGKAVFVDAIETAQVVKVKTIIRSYTDHHRSAPRFILVGQNAKTEQALSGALVGIVTDLELPPIQVLEHLNDSKPLLTTQGPSSAIAPRAQSTNAPEWSKEALWLRGGLPESLNADSEEQSFAWRSDYLKALLRRDWDCWGIHASDRLPDVFQYIANTNGNLFDESKCANYLSVKKESIRNSLDVLERIGLLRCLPNWPAGSNKSMREKRVYYVRDCGLLHAALGIMSMEHLREHDALGHSWEGFAIEAIVNSATGNATPAHYRDGEDEIDLILQFSINEVYAIEIKLKSDAKAKKGFAIGCKAVGATHKMVVHSGETDFNSGSGVPRLKLVSALRWLPV